MNKEQRKIYNKKYHEEHGKRVEAYLSVKSECELCGRNVRYSYMNRHKRSNYCKNHTKNIDISKLTEDQMKELVIRLAEKGCLIPGHVSSTDFQDN